MKHALLLVLVLPLAGCLPDPTGLEDRHLIRLMPNGPYIDVEEVFGVEHPRAMAPGVESAIELRRADGVPIGVSAFWSRDGRTLTLDPVAALEPGSSYTLHVEPLHERRRSSAIAPHRHGDSCATFTFTAP